MFPLRAFTAETAALVTGLSVDRIRRWDRDEFFVPTYSGETRRSPYARLYSYTDLVALRTIARLQDEGVDRRQLTKARTFFASNANEEWVDRRFYVKGGRLSFSHDDLMLATKPLGQVADEVMLDLGPIVRDIDRRIQRLSERGDDQIGQIVSDRFIMRGAPIIAGTRIPVQTIYAFHKNGYSREFITREFPRLTDEDIDAAVKFVEDPSQLSAAS